MAESAEEIVYVFDASSWISIDGDPDANRILAHLDVLVERGSLKCPPQCINEVRSEYIAGWIKIRRKSIAHNLRTRLAYLQLVGEVTYKFAGMAGARGKKNKADPYIVAYAAYRNRTENPTSCVVVCDESALVRPNRKIPTACTAFAVRSLPLKEMLRAEFPDQDW